MRILDSTRFFAVIFTIGFNVAFRSYADTLYVDNKLSVSSTKTYSISTRSGNGNNGKAFNTIQMALDSMKAGDVICIRGGVYKEHKVTIPLSKNGTSWNPGKFNSMISFPGEWAILDGEKNVTRVSGRTPYLLGNSDGPALKFWKFERIEIRNGATADGQNAAGFFGNMGPFHFRSCVFRDNIVGTDANNPAGIEGYVWQDCIVEYCYFYNNGAATAHWNSAHITVFSDYDNNNIAENGFVNKNAHTMGNCYRYNLFESSSGPAVAIKYKNDTFLTGRNPSAGKGYNDTYKNRGDHIHHNIFRNTLYFAIDARQDFVQIYNNIFDLCYGAVTVGEWGKNTIYKASLFNNTILGNGQQGLFISHCKFYAFQEPAIVQYVFNNIVDNCGDDWNTSDITLERTPDWTAAVIDSFKIDRNFIFKPAKNKYDANGTNVFWYGYTNDPSPRHTVSAFANRFPGSKMYFSADIANSPYRGTSGAARLITRGDYKFSDQENISNSGKNIRHPFIDTMKIPGYIGATNPSDLNNNQWVSDVLNLIALSTSKQIDPTPVEDPTPVNNAPVVSLVSVANNTSPISDSVVTVRWKAQDDQGVNICSLFVSINDSSDKLITARKSAVDSISWNIPLNAQFLKFRLKAYDSQGKYGEGTSIRYQVSIIRKANRQIRLYAYVIDGNRLFTVWGKYADAPSLQRTAIVCRTDRYASSPAETGSKVYYSGLTSGSMVLNGFNSGQLYYVALFGQLTSGVWSACLDSIKVITSNISAIAGSAFTDTLYVPEDNSESVTHTLNCFKGNNSVYTKGSVVVTGKIVGGKRAVAFTVPSSVICDSSGFYAYLVRSTAKYVDTIRVSHPVRRLNGNLDNFVTLPGKLYPVSVTAKPVNSGLGSIINYLNSPVEKWFYDNKRAQITQWTPVGLSDPEEMYYEYGQIADSFFNPLPGRLFWVLSNESVKFDFGQSLVTDLYEDVKIPINSGWTHISLPSTVPVTVSQIMKATSEVWSNQILDSLVIYRWRQTVSGYSTQIVYIPKMRVLSPDGMFLSGGPGTGYAIFNESKTAKSLVIPVTKLPLNYLSKSAIMDEQEKTEWSICLDARLISGDSLPSAIYGYSSISEPAYYQPAPSLDEVKIMIHDSKSGENYGHLLTNESQGSNLSFEVAIVNNSMNTDTVVFAIGAMTGLPKDVELTIKDNRNNRIYSGSDSVVVGLLPEQTVYLTIDGVVPTPVQSKAMGNQKFGISKLSQNMFSNDVKVEFCAPPTVNKVTVSLYTLNGQAMIRESRLLTRGQNLQTVDLSLKGHSISNGNYIIKLSMKDNNGKEMQFKAPLLLVHN